MPRSIQLFGLFFGLSLFACGGGAAPSISDFQITTSPVLRGKQANGTITVSDADGLAGLTVKAEISGPAVAQLDISAQGLTSQMTQQRLAIVFVLSYQSPVGTYTAKVFAEDSDGNKSNELSAQFQVQ